MIGEGVGQRRFKRFNRAFLDVVEQSAPPTTLDQLLGLHSRAFDAGLRVIYGSTDALDRRGNLRPEMSWADPSLRGLAEQFRLESLLDAHLHQREAERLGRAEVRYDAGRVLRLVRRLPGRALLASPKALAEAAGLEAATLEPALDYLLANHARGVSFAAVDIKIGPKGPVGVDIDDPEDLEEIFDLDDVDVPDHLDEDPNAGDLMRAKRIVIVVDWSAVDGYLMGLDLDE